MLHGPGRRRGPGRVRHPAPPGRRPVGDDARRTGSGDERPVGRCLRAPRRQPVRLLHAGHPLPPGRLGPAPPADGSSPRCWPTCVGARAGGTIVRGGRHRRRRALSTAGRRPPTAAAAAPRAAGPRGPAPPSGVGPRRRSAGPGRVRRRQRPAGLSGCGAATRTAAGRSARRWPRPGPRPARCRAGGAGGAALPRRGTARCLGLAPSRPRGWSRPTWSPTRRGASRVGSRPIRRATAGPSAGSWRRPRRRRPGLWPTSTTGRSRCCFPARMWCGWVRSGRRRPRACVPTAPAAFPGGRAGSGGVSPGHGTRPRGDRDGGGRAGRYRVPSGGPGGRRPRSPRRRAGPGRRPGTGGRRRRVRHRFWRPTGGWAEASVTVDPTAARSASR